VNESAWFVDALKNECVKSVLLQSSAAADGLGAIPKVDPAITVAISGGTGMKPAIDMECGSLPSL